jgi:hypothetical protein
MGQPSRTSSTAATLQRALGATLTRRARANGIDKMANGIISRGVLLDIARLRGVEAMGPARSSARPISRLPTRPGRACRARDVLLLRTDTCASFTVYRDRVVYMKQMPGWASRASVAARARRSPPSRRITSMVEVWPPEDPAQLFPLHGLCIRDVGLTLGEMFDLEALAADCAADGVWECLFTAPPLRVTGGVGSPLNPLAVK